MGKATIVTPKGDGLYTIQPVFDTARPAAEIDRLTAANAAIDTRLGELSGEIVTDSLAVDTATAELQAAVVGGDKSLIANRQKRLREAQAALLGSTSQRESLRLKKTANTKRIEMLQQVIATPPTVDAWCADYSEELGGSVGTVELGRTATPPIILPGGSAPFDAGRDGQLQRLLGSTPEAVFVNAALLPAAAKWKPRYRTGVASDVDTETDTMTVSLDALEIAGLNCNQATVLSGVPVDYMDCNAQAFSDGDAVLVAFAGQNWGSPTVIGFVHDPQPCSPLQLFGPYSCIVGSVYEAVGGTEPMTWEITPRDSRSTAPEFDFIAGYGTRKIIITERTCGLGMVKVTDDNADFVTKNVKFNAGSWRIHHIEGCSGTTYYPYYDPELGPVDDSTHGYNAWNPPLIIPGTGMAAEDVFSITSCCVTLEGTTGLAYIAYIDDPWGYYSRQPAAWRNGDMLYTEIVGSKDFISGLFEGRSDHCDGTSEPPCPAGLCDLIGEEGFYPAVDACLDGIDMGVTPLNGDTFLPEGVDTSEVMISSAYSGVISVSRIYYQYVCDPDHFYTPDLNFWPERL